MARIAGINLPKEKRIEIALTSIFGIGKKISASICEQLKIDKNIKTQDLTEVQIDNIREAVSKLKTEGDLKRKILMDIKRLQEIGCYRGFRHSRGMPVRGQRTQCNCRTRKGNKKTIANKKIATK